MWNRECITATSGARKRTCISGVSRVLARNGPLGPCRRRIKSRKSARVLVLTPLTATMLNFAYFADLERSLKIGRIVPALQRLHAFPPEDHDWPVREVARHPRTWSCRDILAAVIFDRLLRRRNVFFCVAIRVADLVDGDHVDGRFGLRMQSLDGSAAKCRPRQHRYRYGRSGFHDGPPVGVAATWSPASCRRPPSARPEVAPRSFAAWSRRF